MKNKFDFDTIDINVKNPEDIEVPVYGIENKTVREIMFRINSKKAIKISKGDTAGFTLFLNKGSLLEPIPQTFIKESITVSTVTELEVTVDLAVWKQSGITETNLYSFTFYNENWYRFLTTSLENQKSILFIYLSVHQQVQGNYYLLIQHRAIHQL